MLLCIVFHLLTPQAQAQSGSRKAIRLDNGVLEIAIDLNGGSLRSIRLKDNPINPLAWNEPPVGNLKPWAMGHFLCLDRWGPPSDAEGANGMPYHGEATHVEWSPSIVSETPPPPTVAVLAADLPLAGIKVERRIEISTRHPIFKVSESIQNRNKLGRVLNIVQHPTIAPPFLQASTIVDCNGRRGLAQSDRPPAPTHPATLWPRAPRTDGGEVDISKSDGDANPSVATYLIEEPFGWITAATPSKGLLIGYLWRTKDYPWVSHWRDGREGKPTARGLEFGTTGLHHPFTILTKTPSLWGNPTFLYLDANETTTREYWAFLIQIPSDFRGTGSVELEATGLRVVEKQPGTRREFLIAIDSNLKPRL